jgi:hypothetical protein
MPTAGLFARDYLDDVTVKLGGAIATCVAVVPAVGVSRSRASCEKAENDEYSHQFGSDLGNAGCE